MTTEKARSVAREIIIIRYALYKTCIMYIMHIKHIILLCVFNFKNIIYFYSIGQSICLQSGHKSVIWFMAQSLKRLQMKPLRGML